MRIILVLLLIVSSINISFSQDVYEDIRKLFVLEKHKEVIEYRHNLKDLNKDCISMIALSYLSIEQPNNAIRILKKGKKIYKDYAKFYYILGTIYYAKDKQRKAIRYTRKAIELKPSQSSIIELMGDIFRRQNNLDSALYYYELANEKEYPSNYVNVKIATAYQDKGMFRKALEYCYTILFDLPKKSDEYYSILRDIARLEYNVNNYKKSEEVLLEINEKYPDDLYIVESLIRAYYGQKKYRQTDSLRQVLIDNYNINPSDNNMIYFDSFKWNDNIITACENIKQEKDYDSKHFFYVENDIDFKYTVYTKRNKKEVNDKNIYKLFIYINNKELDLGDYKYTDKFDYERLKNKVISVFEEYDSKVKRAIIRKE